MLYKMPIFRLMGDRAVLVELGDNVSAQTNKRVQALFGSLDTQKISGLIDIVPSYRSLLLIYDPLQVALPALKEIVQTTLAGCKREQLPEQKKIKVPVVYGGDYGPDLARVADHLGITPDEVVRYHTSVTYRVYMIGFTPGYPYMGEVPDAIAITRRKTPRINIPRGSVGIAQKQTGIYPVESPGGWQIIGRTPIQLFDPHQSPPTLLEMGDLVAFYAIPADDWKEHDNDRAI